MKEIPLTRGKTALVSDEDYEYLMQWKWHASRCLNTYYAMRTEYLGYENGKTKTRKVRMHRVIAERKGCDTKLYVDHIDNNGLNNQRNNLRSATHKQNMENQRLKKNNTSGVKGVSWEKSSEKWKVSIRYNGKLLSIGRFKNIEDAIKARLEAEKKYYTHSELCK